MATSGTGGVRRIGDGGRIDGGAARPPLEIAVEARNRWDAIELLRRLHALRNARTYMVQNAPDRWLVYARPHAQDTRILDLLNLTVDGWRADRGIA
jgi:hypothetical protein